MNEISWLKRSLNLDKEIQEALNRRQIEFDKVTKITATLSATGGGETDPHKFEAFASYSDNISELTEQYAQARDEIRTAIEQLPSNKQRRVMLMTYLDGKTDEEIGNAMHYCSRHIRRLRKNALEQMMSLNVLSGQ